MLIRGEAHAVVQAVNRQLTHYAGHVGHIVFLASHLAEPRWQTLNIPRVHSELFNQKIKEKAATRRVSGPASLHRQC